MAVNSRRPCAASCEALLRAGADTDGAVPSGVQSLDSCHWLLHEVVHILCTDCKCWLVQAPSCPTASAVSMLGPKTSGIPGPNSASRPTGGSLDGIPFFHAGASTTAKCLKALGLLFTGLTMSLFRSKKASFGLRYSAKINNIARATSKRTLLDKPWRANKTCDLVRNRHTRPWRAQPSPTLHRLLGHWQGR